MGRDPGLALLDAIEAEMIVQSEVANVLRQAGMDSKSLGAAAALCSAALRPWMWIGGALALTDSPVCFPMWVRPQRTSRTSLRSGNPRPVRCRARCRRRLRSTSTTYPLR